MMVTQFQKFLLISRLTSFYFTFIVDYSLAFHRISDPFRTLQKQICIEERPKEIYPATDRSFPPSKATNAAGQRHASILFLLKFTSAITSKRGMCSTRVSSSFHRF